MRQLIELSHPRAVVPIHMDGRPLEEKAVRSAVLYIVVYLLVVVVATALLTALGVDLLTAFTGAAATTGNVGPGFGLVGSTANFGHLGDAAKWILSATMLLGRLEVYALLLLLVPETWRVTAVPERLL